MWGIGKPSVFVCFLKWKTRTFKSQWRLYLVEEKRLNICGRRGIAYDGSLRKRWEWWQKGPKSGNRFLQGLGQRKKDDRMGAILRYTRNIS